MSKNDAREQSRKRLDWLLLILLLAGLLSALVLGIRRHDLERGNRNVELTLDYAELQNLSVASGTLIPTLLERFKAAGATGVAVSEDLLGDLVSTGQVTYTQRASDAGPLTVIRLENDRLQQRVSWALHSCLPPGILLGDTQLNDGRWVWSVAMPTTFVVRATPQTLNMLGLGLPPDDVRLVKRAGLDVVARLHNHPALTTQAIDVAVSDLKRDGITRLICAGEEVLGFRGLVPYTACKLNSSGLVYGSIEFAKQKGNARISKDLDAELVRVHSISPAEMAGMTLNTAVERFARAAKERNIRLCYVRLPETSGETALEDSVAFVSAIRTQLGSAGYSMGTAEPFGTMSRPRVLLALIALSVAAGAVLLLGSLVSLSPTLKYSLLLTGFLGSACLALVGETGRQLVALSAALVFPTLAVTALIGPHFNRETGEKSPAGKTIALFIGTSAVTLCGALLVSGLLSDRTYMVKVSQFVGIKAAHLLPMLAVIFVMAAGLPIIGRPFSQVREEVADNLRKVVAHPLFVWHALAVVFTLGIIGFALLRTGNDPGLGVTGIELKFRALLESLMAVRPRTKEFLIGHPALFVGIALLLTRRRTWGLPLVVLGVLGQVSLLNTFCHIHTPLNVSILRAVNGLVLGLLLGIAAWFLFARPRGKESDPSKNV